MNSVAIVAPQKYNKKIKSDHSYSISIHNFMPSPGDNMYQVKVCHDIFQHVYKIHTPPEKFSNEAYHIMARNLREKEEKDGEDGVKVASERADYRLERQPIIH